ncbi:PREDICTED: odorant receptor 30a-like, partial [Ceratosolen solmsi marchali]|uniref:Odorant receptor n=1 Tax=Ceratosolen solmsi marchali TaxID=326594 RepID=A0AAJ6VMQ9_9HYME
MDILNSRYFIINKTLMINCGVWPYEKPIKNIIKRLLGLKKHLGLNTDNAIEHIMIILYIIIILIKLITSITTQTQLKLVLDSIIYNWSIFNDEHEKSILIKYAEKGRKLTIFYITYMITALIGFITIPITSIFLNIINPLNVTRPRIHVFNGEFLIDMQKHHNKIYIFDCCSCIITSILNCAADCMYAVSVEYCVALFAIVKFRLYMSLTSIDQNKLHPSKQNDVSYNLIVKTIKLHKEAINVLNILESSFSFRQLILMGINMVIFSLTSVLILTKTGQTLQILRYTLVLIGMFIHQFYTIWPGQKVLEHSEHLFHEAYTTEWYQTSSRTKILLKFLILRCCKPCQLTAGGIYILNFANFLSVFKTSISYITVFY